jgi:hypothetical protein
MNSNVASLQMMPERIHETANTTVMMSFTARLGQRSLAEVAHVTHVKKL